MVSGGVVTYSNILGEMSLVRRTRRKARKMMEQRERSTTRFTTKVEIDAERYRGLIDESFRHVMHSWFRGVAMAPTYEGYNPGMVSIGKEGRRSVMSPFFNFPGGDGMISFVISYGFRGCG